MLAGVYGKPLSKKKKKKKNDLCKGAAGAVNIIP